MVTQAKQQASTQPVVKTKTGDVLILGAGVAAIQAALDLANEGFKVFLVDKAAAIGGKMAQLDKTFPTNDCSMCILSPKFVEVDRHPNIEIITLAEIDAVEGEPGNFKVMMTKKPRYVREELCLGCPTCVRYCPVKIPDKYNQNLSTVRAIYVPFNQAVPNRMVIDPVACLYFQRKCKSCVPVCKLKAIDFTMKAEKIEASVGAIILSPGYETFDPKPRGDFGYGRYKNVVTSLDYERMLSASGPYAGELRRPSDGKPPKKIAWLQCVGSRQVTPGGNSYCSSVCCMYTTKQAILTKEHDASVEATIFNNDIRAYGKDFERFYQRAQSMPGVRYIRSYVTAGREIPNTKNVTIKYALDSGEVKEEEFDLVVLSIGMAPPAEVEKLAGKLAIELNSHHFCKTGEYSPVETSRPGIFASGAFRGPMDIPESVLSGSGAAALCGQLLADRRGKLAREKVYPEERDTISEEPRIGVFVCHCGTNIASVVDVSQVAKYAATLSNVAYAEDTLFACSIDSNRHIADMVKEKKLNRVIIAACTPRTHEPLFQETMREAGLNKHLFIMANIREHCSWVHSREHDKATQKSKDLIRMAVARAMRARPLQELETPIIKAALVIGGGIAGMTSALNLANQGFEVQLLEKSAQLGGMARRIHHTLESTDVQEYLAGLIEEVSQHPLIHVTTQATIIEGSGYVGNFVTKVMTPEGVAEIKHGVTIIATGAEEYKPAEYLYGKDDRIMTLLELEERLARNDPKVAEAKSVVMVQCVGCRNKDRPYCSRVCCGQAIKSALKLKEANPERDVYIIFRDMMTYAFKEDAYREAADREVRFIRYTPENPPQVEVADGNVLRVTALDPVLGKQIALDADIVALAAAVVPSESNSEISRLFKVPLNQDGFFMEAHVKLRPVDFAAEGIFLCGTAHYPKYISETIAQAYGAANRAATILCQDKVRAAGIIAEIDKDKCNACGLCIQACYFGAISRDGSERGVSEVNPILCKGCGNCAVVCPSKACKVEGFSTEQIISQIEACI
ncbi:MAG: CoB--CoM heterodisulfide reductase iron-sulfur subunit A family protein [Chloroflexi bacterium]|nr:CoB--CoM heterodisulfide reductase iron-sulfur subunit A family protein [Chloroflexota bacterium]